MSFFWNKLEKNFVNNLKIADNREFSPIPIQKETREIAYIVFNATLKQWVYDQRIMGWEIFLTYDELLLIASTIKELNDELRG